MTAIVRFGATLTAVRQWLHTTQVTEGTVGG